MKINVENEASNQKFCCSWKIELGASHSSLYYNLDYPNDNMTFLSRDGEP